MFDDVCYLISENRIQDEAGVWRAETTKEQVFCKIRSVGGREFHDGGRNGLNPEYVVDIFHGNYDGEREIEIDGKTYSIYRHYRNGDYMELYVERKGGTNGNKEN